MGKLINRIPGWGLLISSLPGSALRTGQALRCQQAFSKPCLVNLISKDTHLVFSMYMNNVIFSSCVRIQICGFGSETASSSIHIFLHTI